MDLYSVLWRFLHGRLAGCLWNQVGCQHSLWLGHLFGGCLRVVVFPLGVFLFPRGRGKQSQQPALVLGHHGAAQAVDLEKGQRVMCPWSRAQVLLIPKDITRL